MPYSTRLINNECIHTLSVCIMYRYKIYNAPKTGKDISDGIFMGFIKITCVVHQLLSISMDMCNTLLCNSTAVPVFNIKPRFFHLFLHSYWTEIITSFYLQECILFFHHPANSYWLEFHFVAFVIKSPVNVTIVGSGRAEWERRSFFMYIVCKYACGKNAVWCMASSSQ